MAGRAGVTVIAGHGWCVVITAVPLHPGIGDALAGARPASAGCAGRGLVVQVRSARPALSSGMTLPLGFPVGLPVGLPTRRVAPGPGLVAGHGGCWPYPRAVEPPPWGSCSGGCRRGRARRPAGTGRWNCCGSSPGSSPGGSGGGSAGSLEVPGELPAQLPPRRQLRRPVGAAGQSATDWLVTWFAVSTARVAAVAGGPMPSPAGSSGGGSPRPLRASRCAMVPGLPLAGQSAASCRPAMSGRAVAAGFVACPLVTVRAGGGERAPTSKG